MELREAVEEFQGDRGTLDRPGTWDGPRRDAAATILNAVADGTLIPADAVFQVRDRYRVDAKKNNGGDFLGIWLKCPLSEALEIRSADDVRREALEEAMAALDSIERRGDREWKVGRNGYSNPIEAAYSVIRTLIDNPQPQGDE